MTTNIRVRYAEVDQMQAAYYANYLVWFEVARGAFCRERGINYSQMEAEGLFMPVVEAYIRYHSFARYDDELTVAIFVEEHSRRTVRFGYRVTHEERLVAEGHTMQVVVDKSGRIKSFSPEMAALFQ